MSEFLSQLSQENLEALCGNYIQKWMNDEDVTQKIDSKLMER